MDKEFKKALKKLLWLDSLFESTDSLWSILDDVEDELEDMFGSDKSFDERVKEFFEINKK